ncbi:MAG TPA: dephospho-CoA kinase [Rhizomicrobium sp.]|nr:dephospho-CoA kinase [Rhizomicrobium sp.]
MERKRPLLVGLTGSIGMGKSETARLFARLGIPVHDADSVVHRLYESGGGAVAPIAEIFPECVTDGRVDRARLSAKLREEPSAFAQLENIVHPLVAADQRAFVENAAAHGAEMVILDVPLLFETGKEREMDAVVVVSAPEDVQRARVLARPGMTEEALDHILGRQTPDVDKRARAHFLVETDKGLDHAFEQVKMIVALLTERAKGENA